MENISNIEVPKAEYISIRTYVCISIPVLRLAAISIKIYCVLVRWQRTHAIIAVCSAMNWCQFDYKRWYPHRTTASLHSNRGYGVEPLLNFFQITDHNFYTYYQHFWSHLVCASILQKWNGIKNILLYQAYVASTTSIDALYKTTYDSNANSNPPNTVSDVLGAYELETAIALF